MKQPEINISVKRTLIGVVDKRWLKSIVTKVLMAGGVDPSVEMGLLITDNRTIQRLNRRYRDEDETTDVLSFQMTSDSQEEDASFVAAPDGVIHLGEVVISYPQAEKQARDRGHSVENELALLIIHGTLHLLRYDHELEDDAVRMRDKEDQILHWVTAF